MKTFGLLIVLLYSISLTLAHGPFNSNYYYYGQPKGRQSFAERNSNSLSPFTRSLYYQPSLKQQQQDLFQRNLQKHPLLQNYIKQHQDRSISNNVINKDTMTPPACSDLETLWRNSIVELTNTLGIFVFPNDLNRILTNPFFQKQIRDLTAARTFTPPPPTMIPPDSVTSSPTESNHHQSTTSSTTPSYGKLIISPSSSSTSSSGQHESEGTDNQVVYGETKYETDRDRGGWSETSEPVYGRMVHSQEEASTMRPFDSLRQMLSSQDNYDDTSYPYSSSFPSKIHFISAQLRKNSG